MKFDNPTEESILDETAKKTFDIVENLSYAALGSLQQRGDNAPPHHLYLVLTAAAAAIQIAAKIMSAPENKTDDEFLQWAEEPAERTAVLVASLLLSRCLLPTKNGFTFEFNPMNINAAIAAMNKVVGKDSSSMLTKAMVETANKFSTPTHFFDNTRSADITDLGSHRTIN